MKYCFGVDVGGTSVKMGLFTESGEILDKWEIVTRTESKGERILPDISASIFRKMQERQLDKSAVLGVGVGVPGPVTEDGTVSGTPNLGWEYKDAKKEMENLTGMKAWIANDANVAALGEMWKGGGLGEKNLVMITLGTGVGGGVVLGGRIVPGSHGAAGEIGHVCVNYEEADVCGCGGSGCLEQYASATGIVRLAKRKLEKEKRDTVLRKEVVTAKAVFDAVKERDAVAVEVAEEFGRYLGHALANLALVVDPTVFVIGGGVSKAGEVLLPFIQKPYLERARFGTKDVRFTLATLGNDAGICGSAKLVLSK
ncbi:MAG: ROK family glucokinase [Ruminococcus sp.]|jgi:glucokinase|nr:ROK family glucokinase [Ruminococcus sp.]